jgi:hypothetical protein
MKKVVLHQNDSGGIAIVFPTGEVAVEDVAKRDIPKGKPFKYMAFDDLPQNLDDVQADFTSPDGFGEKESETE